MAFINLVAGDAGVVVCIVVAMLADAGTCVVNLLRCFDRETFDIAQVTANVNTWASEVQRLFVDKHAHRMPETYTSIMSARLKKPITVVIKGQSYTIGGPSDITEALDLAYSHLNAWVIMAEFMIVVS